MTIDEAIVQLENLKKCGVYLWSDVKAIDIAIKAIVENDTLKTELMALKSGSDVLKICKLEDENAELKRLLRLAVDGFEHIGKHFTMCSHDDCDKCPYYIGERLICPDKWKHAEEALELIGDEK